MIIVIEGTHCLVRISSEDENGGNWSVVIKLRESEVIFECNGHGHAMTLFDYIENCLSMQECST